MVIGVLQFELLIPGAQSLKEKRAVVRSVKDRLHREHQVSVAETGRHDVPSVAVLGLAVVAGDGARAARVLDGVTTKLRSLRNAELGDTAREIIEPAREGEPRADAGEDVAAGMLGSLDAGDTE